MDREITLELRPRSADRRARPLGAIDWFRYGPFLSQIVVVRRCNLECGYCSEFDKTSEPVLFEALVERFEKLRELRSWAVCLTGGEPSLHPRLPELVSELTRMGFRRRMMITNGFKLSRELIESLNESGLTDMQISVDGVEPNATTIKTLRPLRARLSTLSQHARFKVVVSSVIGSAPPEEALDVIEFARENRFIPRVLLIHDEGGQVQLTPEELSVYGEVKRRIGPRFEDADGYREKLIRAGTAPFHCRAGSRYLYVDEFGKVHWCAQTRGMFTKDLLDYGLSDLRAQFHAPKACNPSCTIGCARTASAYDEWRGAEQAGIR